MTKEQAIETLKCFKDNEMQRDKLEIDNRCGGWKVGRIYKSLELNIAIETVLSMLKQQELEISLLKQTHDYDVEMIDEVKGKAVELYNRIQEKEKLINALVDYIAKEDIDELVCKHIKCVDNEEETNCSEGVKKVLERKIKQEKPSGNK